MKRCPTCSISISEDAKKCPHCNTKFNKPPKDLISEKNDIEKNSNPSQITELESLESTEELEIQQIPLKVKPVAAPKKVKIFTKEEKKDSVLASFKISFVVILILLNIILIIQIINKKNDGEIFKTEPPIVNQHTTTEILGNWRTSKDGLFSFEDNYNFFWYEYYNDLDNNYYSGTYQYKQGPSALEEMGYNEIEFQSNFEDVKIENVYSINLTPKYVYKAEHDVTNNELRDNETWWFILMIKEDGTAIGYNKTLDIRYNLVQN